MNNIKTFLTATAISIVLITLGDNKAVAQSENRVIIEQEESVTPANMIIGSYSVGYSTGNTADFAGDNSFRGFGFEYRHFINEKISAGVAIEYQRFYEDMGKQTFHYDGSDLYGSQYNWHNSMPILLTGHYYFNGTDKLFQPYAGIGVGAYRGESELMIGGVSFVADGWQFGFAPEIGTMINICDNATLSIAGRYNNTFETSDLDAQSYINLKFGVAVRF